jgi:hypothetical protein
MDPHRAARCARGRSFVRRTPSPARSPSHPAFRVRRHRLQSRGVEAISAWRVAPPHRARAAPSRASFLENASRRSQVDRTSVRFFWRILLTAFASCCYLRRNKRSIVADRYKKDCLFPSSCRRVIPKGTATKELTARDSIRRSPPGGNRPLESRLAAIPRPRWARGSNRGDRTGPESIRSRTTRGHDRGVKSD